MSDLARNLLTRYYGLNSESTGKRFLSIHESVENTKNEDEKQVVEHTSVTSNEASASEDGCQKSNDDNRKLSIPDETYRRLSRAFDNIEDAYDSNENSDIFEIDVRENAVCNTKHTESPTEREESPNIIPVFVTTENYPKDANGSDLSLTSTEDTFPDNISDVSGMTLRKSQKSSKTSTPLPPVSKKKSICNETFADFSNSELKQFPNEILNKFSQLRMLYMAGNSLMELPDEVFTFLRHLEWIDIRNNQISSLPNSIESHPCIETLLLQANKIEELPLVLCTLPKLKTLQVAHNPIIIPSKDIVASGFPVILEFLRKEWNKAYPDCQVEFKENKIEPKLSTILCYQSPRKSKKKIASPKIQVHDRNAFVRGKCKFYKPSNRCESKGANASMEHRLLWYSKVKDLFIKQASILQKLKDESVLKEWRRDRRSFNIAMEKAIKRNEDDIPFGFDIEDYASIFKQRAKLGTLRSKGKDKQKFNQPEDINAKIDELLETLNNLETKIVDTVTPRTKQNLLQKDIEKMLQFQDEIRNLRKYNDIAIVSLKN
ncbi:PREDICTED: E3 ubiquitin-protein ligase LRSAM1-like [Dufourea novaeangliae]|uniref:Leucine-rich repeat-containing protein 27 n=1 Tax=Dufourea novaeangliae TaxID=178035 RepID=A0A154P7G1_DUFNO|nr:PREDICTED: E3 ubiquitin-protein ligase LRSAM1-like [Dufourea novaeangliae]KZC07781.1 Leucine-rich repeat-containing protein 27 [Dufourea novaeangliae]